jgi:protein TonB
VPTERAIPQPAAPAQAAAVVAQTAAADEAVDLTSFTIATGSGPQYAGGKTTSGGTSTKEVTGVVAANGVVNGSGDLSQGVRLGEDEWDCPWPVEAEALGIDEQIVVIRVLVRADGRVENANLIQDPGNGFGAAALACAKESRFEAARGPDGIAMRALSAPIRVRFTR